MRRHSFFLAAVLIGMAVLPEGFAQVRTWVSPDGLDTNDCSLQAPCRNFAAAIARVASGGEVVALSSGGYGPVSINKSVALISPEGVHAAIAPTAGNAITVAALNTDRVVLRNLYLNAQGADQGITVNSALLVFVERLVISGFGDFGINFLSSTPNANLYVTDSTVRECGDDGIVVGGNSTRASIESVRVQRNGGAGIVSLSPLAIRRSEASLNGGHGFSVLVGGTVAIEDSIATGNVEAGFAASDGRMSLSRCASTFNDRGIEAFLALGAVYVSESTIVGNTDGISILTGGAVFSRDNNTLRENGTNGAFTSTFPAQ